MYAESASYLELETGGLPSMSDPAFVRWIQQSLNKVMQLRLAVDGIAGPQTRSAIRSFQSKAGLQPDGIVGPKTMAALLSAGASPLPGTTPQAPTGPCTTIDRFEFAKATLLPQHKAAIQQLAARIKAAQSTQKPIQNIDLIGHTDPVGSQEANYRLGCLRAWAAAQELKQALGGALATRIRFRIASLGETVPIPSDDAASRRVQICTYTAAPPLLPPKSARCDLAPPKPKPKPEPQQPDQPNGKLEPPQPPRPECNWEAGIDWNEKFDRHYQNCCTSLNAARQFCSFLPPWGPYVIPEDLCRLSDAEFEKRVDTCIFQAVHAEIVQETGIVGGVGNCVPAGIVGKRFAEWKSRTGRRCV